MLRTVPSICMVLIKNKTKLLVSNSLSYLLSFVFPGLGLVSSSSNLWEVEGGCHCPFETRGVQEALERFSRCGWLVDAQLGLETKTPEHLSTLPAEGKASVSVSMYSPSHLFPRLVLGSMGLLFRHCIEGIKQTK